jgi:hypothetical protein
MTAKALREEGNHLYASALDNVPALIKLARLRKALCAYNSSLRVSTSADDLASVYKNLALTSLRLVPLEENSTMSLFQFNESAKYFCEARTAGAAVKGPDWLEALKASYMGSARQMIKYTANLGEREGLAQLRKYAKTLSRDEVYGAVSMAVLERLYKSSSGYLQGGNFTLAYDTLQDCRFYLEEACRYSQGDREEFDEYRELIRQASNECRANQAIKCGNNYLAEISEIVGFRLKEAYEDVMFLCLDSFKEAEMLAKGHPIECEAAYKLGYVFLRLMKNKKKATECLRKALLLCDVIPSSSVSLQVREDATRQLEFAAQPLRSETEKWFQAKAKFLDENCEILEALNRRFEEGTEEFLEHIYMEHPPRHLDYVLPSVNGANMISLVRKALVHYHSDKQGNAPLEWQFLCEQITISLTLKYEVLKEKSFRF